LNNDIYTNLLWTGFSCTISKLCTGRWFINCTLHFNNFILPKALFVFAITSIWGVVIHVMPGHSSENYEMHPVVCLKNHKDIIFSALIYIIGRNFLILGECNVIKNIVIWNMFCVFYLVLIHMQNEVLFCLYGLYGYISEFNRIIWSWITI